MKAHCQVHVCVRATVRNCQGSVIWVVQCACTSHVCVCVCVCVIVCICAMQMCPHHAVRERAHLDDDAVHPDVIVELLDLVEQLLLRRRVGKVDVVHRDANLRTALRLHADVRCRICTITHLHAIGIHKSRMDVCVG